MKQRKRKPEKFLKLFLNLVHSGPSIVCTVGYFSGSGKGEAGRLAVDRRSEVQEC